MVKSPRLPRGKVLMLGRLLNMRYKPSEIAHELKVTTDTVYRSYIPAGCPCETDSEGHIWIVGTAFAEWAKGYIAQKRNKPRAEMKAEEGYCLRCNQVIIMQNPKPKKLKRGTVQIFGRCPICQGKVNRYAKGGQP